MWSVFEHVDFKSVSGTGEVRFVFSAIRGGWEKETERWKTANTVKYCEKQQEGDDISAQYEKKNSKIEVIHIHKRTEYSLQLTETD